MQISINNLKDGLNINHRKENNFTSSYTVVSFNPEKTADFAKGFSEPLSVRFYSTASTTYCCIWGSINSIHFNGSGKAGGYGYDKKSSSLSAALITAGFNVESLSGTGENETAIHQIAVLMGLKHYTIVSAHA